jgi:hypothetical protein
MRPGNPAHAPMKADEIVPPALQSFLTITEVDHAEFLVSGLFRRKFGDPPPDFRRHLVALYRDPQGALHLAGFSHMRPFGDVYLSGGSCSEGDTIRRMQPHEQQALYAAGGVWHLILRYAFRKFADDCDAFFGHCGDRRALEVALGAGFAQTDQWPIIVNWHKPLPDNVKRALTAKVVALGPF